MEHRCTFPEQESYQTLTLFSANSPTAHLFFDDYRHLCFILDGWPRQRQIWKKARSVGRCHPQRYCYRYYVGYYKCGGALRCTPYSRCVCSVRFVSECSYLLLGIAVGWFLTFSQLYIHEAAPAHLRGVVFGFYQTMLSIGSVVGASIDFGTHSINSKRAYQIPLAIFLLLQRSNPLS